MLFICATSFNGAGEALPLMRPAAAEIRSEERPSVPE
jgi:hypothetical protein